MLWVGLGPGEGWGLGRGGRTGERRGRGAMFRLFHLHSLGLISGLVAELDEGHQHGQAQAPDQNVEDPSHITEAEGLWALVLDARGGKGTRRQEVNAAGAEPTYTCTHTFRELLYESLLTTKTHSHTFTDKSMHTVSSQLIYRLQANLKIWYFLGTSIRHRCFDSILKGDN